MADSDHDHSDTDLAGCPECDLLLRLRPPPPGTTARCPRCDCVLATGVQDGFVRPLAFACAALIFMAVALNFPFLAINAVGQQNAMSLPEAISSLQEFGADGVAILVMAFVLLIPSVLMAGVVTLMLALLGRRPFAGLVPLARGLFRLDAWSMADVFAIGVIVSLVKISSLADVVLGTAFWAYLGFAVCFLAAITSLDRVTVWRAIDTLRERS